MKKKKQTLLKTKGKSKEQLIDAALESTRNVRTLFQRDELLEMYNKYRKDGMPPKSAARSTLRMMKHMDLLEVLEFRNEF